MSADFFQPGHTYAYDANGFTAPELITLFRVVADTTQPDTGKRMAFGWIRAAETATWSPHAEPADEWPTCWTDVTEAEGKSSHPADATPGPTGRVARLLDAIHTARGRWTTTRAAQFYRDTSLEPPGAQWSRTRTIARGDLRDLTSWGHLIRHEEPGRQYYTLKTRKDRAR